MSNQIIPTGEGLALSLTLPDGFEGAFPQAHVYDESDTEVAGSPFDLSHSALGRYTNNAVVQPNGRYYALYITYQDAGHTTILPQYARASDGFTVDNRIAESTDTNSKVTDVKTTTDQISFTGPNVNANTQVNSDKTNYTLSPTALDDVENQIWDADNNGHLNSGSTGGNLFTASQGGDPENVADAVWGTQRSTENEPGSFGEALQGIITDARANNLDNLNETISSRLSTDDANSINDEQLLEHLNTQNAIAAVSDKVDPDDFANGVWNALRASYTAAGSFGEALQGVITTARADLLDNLTRLDVDVSTRSTQSSVDATPELVWDVNLPDHQIADSTGEAQEVARAGNDPVSIAQETWKQLTGDNNDPGSFGEAVNRTAFNTDEVKAKTDQLNFSGTRVISRAEVVDDKTNYFLDGSEHQAIANDVWDKTLASHQLPGSTGEALAQGATSSDPNATAAAVWEALLSNHTTAGTFGGLTQLTKNDTETILNTLANPLFGLDALRLQIINSEVNIVAEVNENEVKIDAIIPAINSQTATLTGEINENEVKIDALSAQLTAAETNIISEVDENEVKIDEANAKLDVLGAAPIAFAFVPIAMQRPESGTKDYLITMTTFSGGVQADADSLPTVRIDRVDTGGTVVATTPMTNTGTGQYQFVWTVSSSIDLFVVEFIFNTVIAGNAIQFYRVSEIVSFQGSLDSIEGTVNDIETITTQNNDQLTHPVWGLEQIKLGEDTIIAEIDENQVLIEGVKAKTDNLPNDPASTADTQATNALVNTKPSLAEIDASLATQTDQIRGSSNVDNTQLSQQITNSTSGLLASNDPRLDFLDAAISSRSTLTAGDVWTYFDRTLTAGTGGDFDIDDAQLVWEVLTSAVIPPGSFGDLVRTNLDATVSSRATAQQVSDELAGVAQESTLTNQTATLLAQHSQTQADVAAVKTDTDAIKFKTDNLPADPASEATVIAQNNQTRTELNDVELKVDAIQAKTDNLPPDPARESSVQAIPTDTLSGSDPRLANLDVAVSTRSTLDISDFADFPRNADLQAVEVNIIAEVNVNESKIDDVRADTIAIRGKTDNLPNDPSSTTDVNNSTNTILSALPDLTDTADAVWNAQTGDHQVAGSFGEQATQTKDGVDQTLAGQANLATKQDVDDSSTPAYRNRISTVFDSIAGLQKIIAWADLDGQRQAGTSNAIVTVRDKDGTDLWTQTEPTPTTDGIFQFENAIPPLAPGDNYYVVIEIDVDGAKRISHEPFFTV